MVLRETFEKIEDQHQALNRQFERLIALWADPVHAGRIRELFCDLLVEVGMHFGFEEEAMVTVHYPAFDHHRRQHLAVMTEMGLLLDRIETMRDARSLLRGVEFLYRWFGQHVAESDVQFETWSAAAPPRCVEG
jgi:hemerythrin-like metal-binding protein